jgi:hypothetical protein
MAAALCSPPHMFIIYHHPRPPLLLLLLQAPPGFVFVTGEKQGKVLDGMASYISAQTPLKHCTGADLLAKGMRAVEESRPLAHGERMRHAFVWWHGKMEEPLRCAQYIFAAKNLLDQERARQVGQAKLCVSFEKVGVQCMLCVL